VAKAKTKTIFSCTECGGQSTKWQGQCPHCMAWNTLVETVAAAPATRFQSVAGKAAGVRALGTIAENGTNEGARVAASTALLDRGWNKPASQVEHTGKDGAEEIRVTLRTIVEGRAK